MSETLQDDVVVGLNAKLQKVIGMNEEMIDRIMNLVSFLPVIFQKTGLKAFECKLTYAGKERKVRFTVESDGGAPYYSIYGAISGAAIHYKPNDPLDQKDLRSHLHNHTQDGLAATYYLIGEAQIRFVQSLQETADAETEKIGEIQAQFCEHLGCGS